MCGPVSVNFSGPDAFRGLPPPDKLELAGAIDVRFVAGVDLKPGEPR